MTLRRGFMSAVWIACSLMQAQQRPDFSGSWQRDRSRAPGFVFGPGHWTIRQTASELLLEAGGQTFVFKFDGTENVYVDHSLGDLPNFVRKIRTKAHWEGAKLLTERTSFAEQTNPEIGNVTTPPGPIRTVETIALSADGRTLIVEHRGFRANLPELLHGKPYDPRSDPAVRRYTDFFISVQR